MEFWELQNAAAGVKTSIFTCYVTLKHSALTPSRSLKWVQNPCLNIEGTRPFTCVQPPSFSHSQVILLLLNIIIRASMHPHVDSPIIKESCLLEFLL